MKTLLLSLVCFVIFFLAGVCIAQDAMPNTEITPTEGVTPTVESVLDSFLSESPDTSAEEIVESAQESLMAQMETEEVTAETVQSAIEGELITEDAAPVVNQEAAEAIDSRTQRYAPRIKLDFNEFPLRRLSGRFAGVIREDADVEELEQTNSSLSHGIVKRIQMRLHVDTVRFTFKNRTAVLTGSVSTERQRELIGSIVRMEPGIDQVKNEIRVDIRAGNEAPAR